MQDTLKVIQKRIADLEQQLAEHERRWKRIQPQHVYIIDGNGHYVNDAVFQALSEKDAEIERLLSANKAFREIVERVVTELPWGGSLVPCANMVLKKHTMEK